MRAEPIVDTSRPTIRKTRVVARDHHLVRLDREVPGEPAPWAADLLVDAAVAAVDRADVVLVSDYVKGVCGRRFGQVVLRRARERGIPVVVDSKRPDLLRYRGVTAVTPNEREMDAVAGHLGYSPEEGPHRLRRDGGFEWVVVTRAERGMSAFGLGAVEHFPARARAVADVAGAGDAVAGALALALGAGLALVAAGDFASLVAAAFIRDREDKAVTPRALLDLEDPNYTGHTTATAVTTRSLLVRRLAAASARRVCATLSSMNARSTWLRRNGAEQETAYEHIDSSLLPVASAAGSRPLPAQVVSTQPCAISAVP